MSKHTNGEWRLGEDAQGPCMILHPTREGVALASLTSTFKPSNGFHDDWMVYNDDGTLDEDATHERIEERNANARLMKAAPKLYGAGLKMLEAFGDDVWSGDKAKALDSLMDALKEVEGEED